MIELFIKILSSIGKTKLLNSNTNGRIIYHKGKLFEVSIKEVTNLSRIHLPKVRDMVYCEICEKPFRVNRKPIVKCCDFCTHAKSSLRTHGIPTSITSVIGKEKYKDIVRLKSTTIKYKHLTKNQYERAIKNS